MPKTPSVRAIAWAGFVALAVAMGIGRFAFTPMLPMMQEDMDLGLAQGGWLAGANYLGYLAGALTAAFLPWKASTLLRVGLVLVAVTTALMGWTAVWSMWIAWRSIAGIASAWVLIGAASLCLGKLSSAGLSHKAGLVFAGVGGGIAIAGLVCLICEMWGFSSARTWLTLAVFATIGMLATLPLWWGGPRPTASTEDATRRPDGIAHARLIICYGCFGFGYILPATFLPAQARELLGDPALFGLAWPLFGLAAAISTLACSALLKRFSRRGLWLGAQLIMTIGVALPAWMPGLFSIIVAALCVGGTFMVITMLGMQQAQASGGPGARGLMAALTAAFATGQLAGPVFFSLTHEYFGGSLTFSLYTAAAFLLVSSLLLLKPFPQHTGDLATRMAQSAR